MIQIESASNGHRAHAQRRWHTQGSFCHRRASIWVFQEVAGDLASAEFARPVWGKKANSVEGLLENRHRHLCSKKSLNSCGLLNSLAKLLTISQHQSVNQSSFLKSIMLYKGPAEYKTNLQLVYGVTKEALPFIFADGSQRYSSSVMSPYSDLRCTKYTDHPLLGPCLLASIQSGTPGGAFCAQSWKQGINPLDHIELACLCATVVTLKYVL